MSYARFSADSDVYVFLSVSGKFECCSCGLNAPHRGGVFPATERLDNTDAMLAHLRKHQEAGDTVPDYTFEGLEAEREENDKWIAEHDG